ncbi:nucleotidyl transferase AbiEii/AbiGii toxin family protein [Phosphitispora sp. TUW77]|uniref:nucleotidyl transferase AbiEii/AbiGii toxin family protein n=1 Tax=Phosphitispora sp. TUW77 TaxID=3152361 RepID=UPI003AB81FFC
MKLHLDEPAFETLLLDVAGRTSIRADILEKDYYVTLLLNELADKQKEIPAYFKGGTALYKALGSIRRFSEDIDITVAVDNCSNSQAKKQLDKAANGYSSLQRDSEDPDDENRKGSRTSIYHYKSVVDVDIDDTLQRFGRVKIEATSFTVSEPFEPMAIAPLIYEQATEEQKQILGSVYDVCSFSIITIKLERIFVDKVFAAEFYYQRQEYFDVAKHLYDIVVLLQQERIQAMLSNPKLLLQMISYKRNEEHHRIGSELANKPFIEFTYLSQAMDNEDFKREFIKMQNVYVFNLKDFISLDEVYKSLEALKSVLMNLTEEN